MIYSPEYQAMINVAKTYAEGYKKFPAAKVQDKAAMKPDTAKGESQIPFSAPRKTLDLLLSPPRL